MYQVFDLLNGARMTAPYAEACLANGVTAVHITLNNFHGINPVPDLRHSLNQLANYRKHLRSLSSQVMLVEEFADFERAKKANKLAIVMGYQNVPGVEHDLNLISLFKDLGVRVIQIAHNIRNLYGDGCAEQANAGLSSLGRELVSVLNELDIVIDLSHVGDQSGLDAIKYSKQPVAVTHANCFTVCPNARNKSDAVLDALKVNHGVLGITYLPPVVLMPGQKPAMADVVTHIKYAVDRIGYEHVGIGSDFIHDQPAERYQEFGRKPEVYGTWPWLYPINSMEEQQQMLSSLSGLGLDQSQIQTVAYDNFMRLFRTVMEH
ncbi:dipeptidase [Ottowia thiooxydans]|uniref:dipeptidase n=1 Tax=Ottowia thiooxydans TaxID=219182 RepID=UPI00041238D7|nr:membrane dipeptidase [Ottowia thiooxydans]